MIHIYSVSSIDELQKQREEYGKRLPFAQDLNIEENIWDSGYYKIEYDSEWLGYACIDSAKTLWEFYLEDNATLHAQEIFRYMIDEGYIVAAECKTYDYILMSLCHDFQKRAEGSAYLFRDDIEVNYPEGGLADISLRLATMKDYDRLEELNRIAEEVDFFHNLKEEICNQEVLVFWKKAGFITKHRVIRFLF